MVSKPKMPVLHPLSGPVEALQEPHEIKESLAWSCTEVDGQGRGGLSADPHQGKGEQGVLGREVC